MQQNIAVDIDSRREQIRATMRAIHAAANEATQEPAAASLTGDVLKGVLSSSGALGASTASSI